MHIRNQKDFWAGLLFAAFGLFFSGVGTRYTFGTAARMGPGYFPTVLGIILIILGVVIALGALSPKAEEQRVQNFSWPTILLVLGIGFAKHGLKFFTLFVPSGVPWPVLPFVVIIEFVSFLLRPVTLTLRLFGNMMGGLVRGDLFIEGWYAKLMYTSLYKMHELALHGWAKVILDTLARTLTRRTEPQVKLH